MRATVVPAVNTGSLLVARRRLALAARMAPTVQVDCADGRFVPHSTLGPGATGTLPVPPGSELHLMVRDPVRWLTTALRLRIGRVAFHVESVPDPRPLIAALRVHRIAPIAAANPSTSLARLLTLARMVQGFLVLGVHPGPSGSRFHPGTLRRIRALRSKAPRVPVAVDGGVTVRNRDALLAAGASRLVVGSSVFSAPDPLRAYRELTRA